MNDIVKEANQYTDAQIRKVKSSIGGNTVQALTSGTTITLDASKGNISKVTLTSDSTLVITNPTADSFGIIEIKQDGVGNRGLTLPGNSFIGSDWGLSIGASQVDVLGYYYDGVNFYWSIENYGVVSLAKIITFANSTNITHTGNEWIATGAGRLWTGGKIPANQDGYVFATNLDVLNASAWIGLMPADGSYIWNSTTYGVFPFNNGTYDYLPTAAHSFAGSRAATSRYGVRRLNSGGVGTVQAIYSNDGGINWIVINTYAGNITADLFVVGGTINTGDKLTNPRGIGLS